MIGPPGYVRIERTFDAPAEDVFEAWTSVEVMRRWYHAGPDWETPEAEVDLRVGGNFRVVMRKPDGSEVELSGEYTEIDRPHRLAMTCTFSDDPAGQQQLVELTFSESDGATTVVLINSDIPTDERRDAQQWGWEGCLDQIERALRRLTQERAPTPIVVCVDRREHLRGRRAIRGTRASRASRGVRAKTGLSCVEQPTPVGFVREAAVSTCASARRPQRAFPARRRKRSHPREAVA